jgi:hypothetical protein
MSTVRRTITIVLAAASLVALLAAGVALGPGILSRLLRLEEPTGREPRIGDPAPDVVLSPLDGSGTIHLAEKVGGRPLLLIFGSYT